MTARDLGRNQIRINLWGKEVGLLSFERSSGYSFAYSPAWVDTGVNPSPLMMPVRNGVYSFPSLNPETYHGLPGMIADALPDRFGNAVIDAYMAQQGVDAESVTVLQRLAYIGRRAIGAMEFEPVFANSDDLSIFSKPLVMQEMIESARKLIAGHPNDVMGQLLEIGSSAGGARAKAVVGYNPATGELVSGQLDLPDGYQHYLLKFDGVEGKSGVYGRRESAYLSMAKAAGINTPEHFLLADADRAHLMIKRFDRTDLGEKIHTQTLCGLAHLDFNQRMTTDYAVFLRAINAMGLGRAAIEEGFRRMVFNVAGVNCDDHTKNQSFLMDKNGGWSLAPAYDLAYAWSPQPDHWTHQHQMLVNGKAAGITRDDLHEVGAVVGIKPDHVDQIIDEVLSDGLAHWLSFAQDAGMEEQDAQTIMDKQKEAIMTFAPGFQHREKPSDSSEDALRME